jgi:hypothetical protein
MIGLPTTLPREDSGSSFHENIRGFARVNNYRKNIFPIGYEALLTVLVGPFHDARAMLRLATIQQNQ